MARRRALLPFPAGCLSEVDVTFNYAEVEVVGSSKQPFRSHLTVKDEGTVTTNCVSNDVS